MKTTLLIVTLILLSDCQLIVEDTLLVKTGSEACGSYDPECVKRVPTDVCFQMDCNEIDEMIHK